jgi:hypothetical protein
MGELSAIFGDVYPQTPEEWEDAFRRDTNIDREIAFWRAIAQVYRHFNQDGTLDAEQRQETFHVIVACANNGTEHALKTVRLQRLAALAPRPLSLTWRASVGSLPDCIPLPYRQPDACESRSARVGPASCTNGHPLPHLGDRRSSTKPRREGALPCMLRLVLPAGREGPVLITP